MGRVRISMGCKIAGNQGGFCMGWKIYFWVIGLSGICIYFYQGFSRYWEIIDLLVFIPACLGLYGFAWKKTIATPVFWRIYFLIHVGWNLYYQFLVPIVPKAKEMIGNGTSQFSAGLLNLAFFVPLIIALYLYAFKSNIWKSKNNS